jgi:hypothetical protein
VRKLGGCLDRSEIRRGSAGSARFRFSISPEIVIPRLSICRRSACRASRENFAGSA